MAFIPRRAAAGALGVLALSGGIARAEPAARLVYLRGKGTETCPSETDLRQAVQVRLGYDPFSTYASSTMFAEVNALSRGFSASLKLVDGDNAVRGDRTLKVSGSCAELMDAVALTMSIAIDPMYMTREGPSPDAPPAEKAVDSNLPSLTTPTSASEDEVVSTNVSPTSKRKTAPVMSVALGPIASVGSAPAVSTGGAMTFDVQLGRLLGGVEGRADLPASASAGRLGSVQSSLVSGSVFAGVREGPFFVCAVGSLGRLSATSEETATVKDAAALLGAAGLRVGVAVALSERLEARFRAEGLANLTRHTLEISGQRAYQQPVASGNVSAALAVRFW